MKECQDRLGQDCRDADAMKDEEALDWLGGGRDDFA